MATPASPSYASLTTPLTRAQILQQWGQLLQSGAYPFPVMAWQTGSTFPVLMSLGAGTQASEDQKVTNIGAGGYMATAGLPALQVNGISPWVDLLLNERGLTRGQPQTTVGAMTCIAVSGAPTIGPGALIVTDGVGHEYTNTTGGTIAGSPGTVLTFTANAPGASYNIAANTPMQIVMGPPGITVQTTSVSWITMPGTDSESDGSCAIRYANVLPSLGTGSPTGAIKNWCFAASNDVRAAYVQAAGDGMIRVVVYSQGAPVSAQGLANITAFVGARLPIGTSFAPGYPTAPNPIPLLIQAVIYGPASINANGQAIANATAAIKALIDATPIGGYPISTPFPVTYGLSCAFIMQAIVDGTPGVTRVDLQISNDDGLTYSAAQGVVTNSGGVQVGGQQTNFLMPLSGNLPQVLQAPTGSNPFALAFSSV